MARARRRNGKKTPESGAAEEPEEGAAAAEATEETTQDNNDSCPACNGSDTQQWAAADKENWVRCDACKTWYHWRCAGDGSDLDAIDKWFCKACMAQDPARTITMKPPARKSARKKTQRDYAGLHNVGAEAGPDKWLRILEGKKISGDPFRRMKGSEVGVEWLENDQSAMKEPIVIEAPEGLGMKMPPKSFTVEDVATVIGEDSPVEVIGASLVLRLNDWDIHICHWDSSRGTAYGTALTLPFLHLPQFLNSSTSTALRIRATD